MSVSSLPSPSPSFLVFCSCPNFLNELARKRLLRRLKTGRILDTRHQYLMNVSGFRYSRQIEFQEELMNFLTTWLFLAVSKTLRGGGGGEAVSNFFFSALRASVWSKSNGGGGRSPGPLPWIRHWFRLCPNKQRLKHVWNTLLKRDWTVFFAVNG